MAAISPGGVRALFEFRMLLEPEAAASVATSRAAREELLTPFWELLEQLNEFASSFRALALAEQERAYQGFYEPE
ncbi:hypothetical protein [Streptomyces viridochromogenes]|uniref:hypothetical protein n=1 Tax=Streptomyces viridochromogenes TaxID=1938 RepID=UPI000314CE36|nr:hypothetical protein [Streptomyces viridochromogenes]